MARPQAKILKTIDLSNGTTWDILHSNSYYVITYKDRPCGIRQRKHMVHGFKYMKLSYSNVGNALAQARRLNEKFNCEDFNVMEIV